jgi:hypothetical protein
MRCAVMNDALVPPEDAEGQTAASEFMEPSAVGRRRGIRVDGLQSLDGLGVVAHHFDRAQT